MMPARGNGVTCGVADEVRTGTCPECGKQWEARFDSARNQIYCGPKCSQAVARRRRKAKVQRMKARGAGA